MEPSERSGAARWWPAPVVVVVGALAVAAVVRVVVLAAGHSPSEQVLVYVVVCGALLACGASVAAGRGGGSGRAGVVVLLGVVLLLPASAAAALHGTRWGFAGLSGDASFRTEAATRYADTWHLTDYAYRGLPAYYPPALSWVQGRVATLLDVEAWTVMQPSQLVLAGAVPLLSYFLWRRVVPPLPAASVMATTALLTADLVKPDEWLVLMCAVPWWLEVVRGVRAAGVRPWPWWAHGVVGGLVLLTHTFYLLPLAVAALLGWAVDLCRRRPFVLGPGRALAVAGAALTVAVLYWLPPVLARLGGAPTDNLQMRYTFPGANVPPFPLPIDAPGVLGAIGVVWLLMEARRLRRRGGEPGADAWGTRASGLAVMLGGAYLTMAAGGVGVALGVGLLTFKTDELVVAGLGTVGVLGLFRVVELAREVGALAWLDPGVGPSGGPAVARVTLTLGVAALVVLVVSDYVAHTVVGREAVIAQTTTYPDGGTPEAADGRDPLAGPAFSFPGDPSIDRLEEGWTDLTGRPPDADIVLVTTQVGLLATTTVHPFTTWKAIYSNPLGRFEQRLSLLREVAGCSTSSCAHDLLVDNPYDTVDGLVLERRSGGRLALPILVDGFPDRTAGEEILFPAEVLAGPGFAQEEMGRLVLIAVSPTR